MSHDELLSEYERIKARAQALEREANRLQEQKDRLELENVDLRRKLEESAQRLAEAEARIAELKRELFGPKSDRLTPEQQSQLEQTDLNLIVAGSRDGLVMVEGGARLVVVYGIGRVLHIAFWEPHFAAEYPDEALWREATHRLGAKLHPLTIEQNAITSFKSRTTLVPAFANTIGPGIFLRAEFAIGGADGVLGRGMQWQGLEANPMRRRIKNVFGNVKGRLDAIVLKNSTYPHVDMNFFYVTGLLSGLFTSNLSGHALTNAYQPNVFFSGSSPKMPLSTNSLSSPALRRVW
jgi:hypothetical protein